MADLRDELVDLLDHPAETLSAEYKSSLDLNTNEHRATLACHIAAITNHGGGYIVFGFNDDLSLREPAHDAAAITRDLVSSIVKKYLEPAVNCDVRYVKSAAGRTHAVIVIPSHGAVPICAKAGGPEKNFKQIGITKGTYYIRAVGPASVPINSASEWQELIRRCVLHDRSSLLSSLGAALKAPQPAIPQSREILGKWHEVTARALEAAVRTHHDDDELLRARKQFSYFVERADGETLPHATLRRAIDAINNEVKEHVQSGWSMFYPFDNRNLLRWNIDPSLGEDEDDFLEMNLAIEEKAMGRDFWRISPDGRVSLIREYWEDSAFNIRNGIKARTSLDPFLVTRDLAEVVWHASFFAAQFQEPTQVLFKVEFKGLRDRSLHRFDGYRGAFGSASASDSRQVSGAWPAATLQTDWPNIVSELAAPIGRLFDSEQVFSADRVAAKAGQFRRL